MSIQQQIKQAFHESSELLHPPARLDSRIEQLFRDHQGSERESMERTVTQTRDGKDGKRFSFRPRRALVGALALCLLFSGIAYASQLVYRMNSAHVQVEQSVDAAMNLPAGEAGEIRASLARVRSQLQPGEAANVYIAKLAERKLPALLRVHEPQRYASLEQWQAATSPAGTGWTTPTVLPEGYSFAYGEADYWLGGMSSAEWAAAEQSLKRAAEQEPSGVAWEQAASLTNSAQKPKNPGIILESGKDRPIEIRYQWFPVSASKPDIRMLSGSQGQAEEVLLPNGSVIYYTADANHLFSENGYLQTLQWLTENADGTVYTQIITSSHAITKNDLTRIAASMD